MAARPAEQSGAYREAVAVSEVVMPLFLELVVALFGLSSSDWAALPLTMPQFKVLALLVRGETPTVSEVARLLQVTPPTASGILDRLEEKGLIVREEDPVDRRVVHVRLSADRRALLRQLFPLSERRLNDRVDHLPPDERARLAAALRDVLAALALPAGERTSAPLESRS
ncbi:MAG: MarR family transcriptional regulator [Chloroflexota bacterium]|nr:MarR family transcriptional regulator [Dehalococcoidia bacterium]MDW8255061.1 MarR family transcriptional regulator [Chloroflexota bacterium]